MSWFSPRLSFGWTGTKLPISHSLGREGTICCLIQHKQSLHQGNCFSLRPLLKPVHRAVIQTPFSWGNSMGSPYTTSHIPSTCCAVLCRSGYWGWQDCSQTERAQLGQKTKERRQKKPQGGKCQHSSVQVGLQQGQGESSIWILLGDEYGMVQHPSAPTCTQRCLQT